VLHQVASHWFLAGEDILMLADDKGMFQVHTRMLHCCQTVVTLLLHCCHTAVTLLLHCCYTVVTLLLHCCYTVVTLLSHCCYSVVTLLLHCCYTLVTVYLTVMTRACCMSHSCSARVLAKLYTESVSVCKSNIRRNSHSFYYR
jgi:hypothetical protein